MSNLPNISNYNPSWQDPFGAVIEPSEWAMIIVFSIVSFMNLITCCYLLWNRNYLPLRLKNIYLVILSFFGGFCFTLGAMASFRVLPQVDHPIFLLCSLWDFWIETAFGVGLFATCLIFRFFQLYWIVKLHKPVNFLLKMAFFVFWSPTIIIEIIFTTLHASGPFYHTILHTEVCTATYSNYIFIGLIIFYYLLFLFFGISLMNIKQEYLREYIETRNSIIFLTIILIPCFVLGSLDCYFYTWGRVLICFLILTGTTSIPYQFVGIPIYYSIFDREGYEQRFIQRMNTMKNVNTVTTTQGTTLQDFHGSTELTIVEEPKEIH